MHVVSYSLHSGS